MKRFYIYVIFMVIFGSWVPLSSAQHVEFPDVNLASTVREALDLPAGADIPKAKLATLTRLSAAGEGISNLTGLEHASQLTVLDLGFNRISDISPLTGLTNLTELFLLINQISDISPLTELTQLTLLNLESNQIRDISPLAGLTELRTLLLWYNQISDLSPLAGLTQLSWLDLTSNQISDISPLTGLTELKLLRLVGNQIGDLSPLTGLTNLTGLDLGSNQISDLSPLAGLTQLTGLHLGSNQISDLSSLAGLTQLTGLGLSSNQISDISPLTGLTNLTELSLSENPITDRAPLLTLLEENPDLQVSIEPVDDPIDDPAAAWMPDPNLRAIVRAILGLTPIEPLTQQALQALTSLDPVSGGFISGINNLTGLEHATQLTSLNLRSNAISDISPLAGLTQLTTLDLTRNEITDISPLAGLTQLMELKIGYNQISDISLFTQLTQLTVLDLAANEIRDVTLLTELTELTELHLSNNAISDITPLTGLTQLTRLSLGGNAISDITPLTGLTQLTRLSLYGNEINDLTPLAGLTELTELGLENNKISDVSPLTGLTNLNALWLSGNPIIDRITGGTPLEEILLWDLLQANPHISTDIPIDAAQRQTLSNKDLEINAGIPLYALVSSQGAFPSFSPDGTLLAYVAFDDSGGSTVKLWDVGTKQNIATLEGHTGIVLSVSFSPDAELLASTDIVPDENGDIASSTVKLWDVGTKQNIATFEVDAPASVAYDDWVFHSVLFGNPSISFSPDGSLLIFTSIDGTVELWDVTTRENIPFFEEAPRLTNVLFSPDGTLLAYSVPDGTKLWNVEMRANIATLSEDTALVSFSPDGSLLAYTAADGIKLWNMETKETITTITLSEGYMEELTTLSFSPNGTMLILAGVYSVSLWDVKNGRLLALLEGGLDLSFASVTFSPDGTLLATMAFLDDKVILWDLTSYRIPSEPEKVAEDVNNDGVVNIQDLVLVAANLGKMEQNAADVNADDVVDIRDLVKVAGMLGNAAAAPALHPKALAMFTAADAQQWLSQAQHLNLTDITSQRGIHFLQQLLVALIPKETALLPNYPNPFNPETWIPYQLAKPADVTLTIYAVNGQVVRRLALGHQPAGLYQNRSRAAYWDGRNAFGERVASGLYFYTLSAGDFTATRKMLIQK